MSMTAPSDREVFLNEVREAIAPVIAPHLRYGHNECVAISTTAAQAAIDAMVRHMGPSVLMAGRDDCRVDCRHCGHAVGDHDSRGCTQPDWACGCSYTRSELLELT